MTGHRRRLGQALWWEGQLSRAGGAGGVRGAEGEGAGGGSVGTQMGQGEVSAG